MNESDRGNKDESQPTKGLPILFDFRYRSLYCHDVREVLGRRDSLAVSQDTGGCSLKLNSQSQKLVTMPGLMKRLSKSAGDLSPCRKKSRSNSDEEFQLEEREVDTSVRTELRRVSSQYKQEQIKLIH